MGTFFFNFYGKTKLLDAVLGLVKVEDLVSVEDAPSLASLATGGK